MFQIFRIEQVFIEEFHFDISTWNRKMINKLKLISLIFIVSDISSK